MKKKNAYIIGLLSILFLTLFSVYIDKSVLVEIIPSSIAGIVGITLASSYIVGNDGRGNGAIGSAGVREEEQHLIL